MTARPRPELPGELIPPAVSLMPGMALGCLVIAAGLVYFHTSGWHPSGFAPANIAPEYRSVGGFWPLLGHALFAGLLVTVLREWGRVRSLGAAAEANRPGPESRVDAARRLCAEEIGTDAPRVLYEGYFEKKRSEWQGSAGVRWWWYFSWALAVFLPSVLYLMTGFRDPVSNAPVPAAQWFTPVAVGGFEMLIALLAATKVRVEWEDGLGRVASALLLEFAGPPAAPARRPEPDAAEREEPHAGADGSDPLDELEVEQPERTEDHVLVPETPARRARRYESDAEEPAPVPHEEPAQPPEVEPRAPRAPRVPRRYDTGDEQ